jgi:peptidoglycan lytic transglycosylase
MKRYPYLIVLVLLTACTTSPPRPVATPATHAIVTYSPPRTPGGYYQDDGPGLSPPPNLDSIPDAVPKREALDPYANRAYVALGQLYVPETELKPFAQEGVASWYGRKFNGKPTTSGEPYDMYAMTAAHPTLPIPSYARVTALATGKSVVVRINDRGPFHSNRILDLSYTAAYKLGIVGTGQGRVRVESINPDSERVGRNVLPSGFYVQLGAFRDLDNARALLARIHTALGDDAIQGQILDADGLHRVSLGPIATETLADRLVSQAREVLHVNPEKRFRQ